jgi:hypothetical protein
MEDQRDRIQAINSEPYLSSKEKAFIDSISTIDDYGFQVRQDNYWIPELLDKELVRLELNQSMFSEFVKGRFPPEINKARLDEYHRIQILKKSCL